MRDFELSILRYLTCELDPPWADLPAHLVDDPRFGAAVFVLLLLVLALSMRGRAQMLRVLLTVVIGLGLAHGVREILWRTVPRARPVSTFPKDRVLMGSKDRATCASRPDAIVARSYPPTSPSFPSSHVITAGAFAAAIFCASRGIGIVAWLYVLLVGLGRLWWSKHWPSDVVGSLVLSAGVGWLAWRIAGGLLSRIARRSPKSSVPGRATASPGSPGSPAPPPPRSPETVGESE